MNMLPHGTEMVYGCVEKKGIRGEAQNLCSHPKECYYPKANNIHPYPLATRPHIFREIDPSSGCPTRPVMSQYILSIQCHQIAKDYSLFCLSIILPAK